MTFRDRMPLGQAYNAHGQQQFQQPMHHEVPPEQHHQYQYQQQPQPHQQHQYRPQLPQPQQFIPSAQTQTAYSHYPPGGFPNGNQQQYQHNQYVQPTFPQHQAQPQPQPQRQPQPQAHQPHHQQQHHAHQPPPLGQRSAQFYPSSAAPAQFQTNYNGAAFNQQPSVLTTTPAPSPSSAPLPQFVNPSLLQTQPVPPPSRPASHAASPVSQPAPSPAATMSPQLTPAVRTPQPGQRVLSTKTQSPRIEKKEPPSRHGPALQIPKENRRPSTGAGVAKSPATPATPGGSSHAETLPLLLCVAEDCFEKADAAAQKIAKTMTSSEVAEHHKLVATGLGCLDTALKSNKLWPRLEARLCLRYASVLTEQTTNIMEAETTLTRGIAVCDKNRFLDLKYCSQFLLMKTLFQRNQNAAFKLIEGHITDCGTFRHVHWIYAFRFLKASFYLQSGNAADHHAIENLRRLSGVAAKREDHSIFAVAMLLEALTHLAAMKDDWATRVQMCIAQVAKLQMETSVHFPQVDVLLILLDLACSLHQKTHHISLQKVSLLQRKLDELKTSDEWPTQAGEMLLPINRMPNTLQTISNDTRAVLRVGEGNVDYLVLSTLGKEEAWALSWVFNGIVAHHKSSSPGRCSSMWSESVRLLEDRRLLSTSKTLPEHLREEAWAKEIICYANVLIGLQAAGISDWKKVRQCIDFVRQHKPSTRFLDILLLYLEGVFWQGSADLAKALEIWRDKRLEVEPSGALKNGSRLETEVSILAALSRLWILQEPGCRDEVEIAELVDTLRPICEDNPDLSIRTAFGLVMSSAPFGPTATLNQAKAYLQVSLNGARDLNNTQYLSIALNIMRSRLFENVVGEQALKSAKAAATQARKSGNILWMSVAEGMLAQSYEMQGQINEAKIAHENGVRLANEAYAKTRVD